MNEWYLSLDNGSKPTLYIDDNTSLEFSDFKDFIESRRKNLKEKLKEILK